jgi:hypothetical protein
MTLTRQTLNLEVLEARTLLATCNVTRLTDLGAGNGYRGDLRYCITKANAEPGEDLIIFHPTAYGTINLTGALPSLSDDVIIDGPGANVVKVRRDTGGNYRIFTVDAATTVGIFGLTITNGREVGTAGTPNGGGIRNNGTLALGAVAVVGNSVQGTIAFGGGITNQGVMTIVDSTIAENRVDGGSNQLGNGGALGGGIAQPGGMYSLTISNSTIANNTVSAYAGWNSNTAVSGGIYSDEDFARITIRFSTVTGNLATSAGAASGGGLSINGGDLRNTLVAGNSRQGASGAGADVSGAISSLGHNLVGDSAGGSGYSQTDLLDVDPMIGSLTNNGGPTQTVALLPSSPAIDSGDNTNAPEFDQRGEGFPRIVNGTIDRGAFEVQATGTPPVINSFFIDPLAVMAMADQAEEWFSPLKRRRR